MKLFGRKAEKEKQSKFQAIYEKYRYTMYSVAFNITKNSYDAEDVIQSSSMKLLKILHKVAWEDIDTPKCKNLVITITKNTAIDFLRKTENTPIPYERAEETGEERSLEDLYIEISDYNKLVHIIDEMDEKYKEVLRLRCIHELSTKETAEILNISEGNVNTRLMRAKRILAQKLEEYRKNGQ